METYVVEKEFYHNGMKCIVIFTNMGHRCGYVGVSEENSLYGKDYCDHLQIQNANIEEYFDVHGGITYAGGGKNSTYPIESDLWWFGFDCAHLYDGKDLDLVLKLFPDRIEQVKIMKEYHFGNLDVIRELNYVEEECKRLADQLIQFN